MAQQGKQYEKFYFHLIKLKTTTWKLCYQSTKDCLKLLHEIEIFTQSVKITTKTMI